MTTDSAKPLLLSIPLEAGRQDRAIVIVHRHQAHTSPERLINVSEFADDGRGGYIAAAQTSDQRYGYLNEAAQWVVAPRLEDAKAFSEEGLARFRQEGYWGYVNTAGELAIAAQFEDARGFWCGLAAVQAGNDRWRFIDATGKFAFDNAFARVGDFSPAGLAPAVESRKNSLTGYIDRTGQWAIKPQFKSFMAFGAGGVAPASIDGDKYGLIDQAGNWVLAPVYPRIEEFNADGLAYFSEEDYWSNGHGYLNAKGEVVVKGDRELSRHMVAGIAYAHYAGREYMTREGQLLRMRALSWGGHFNKFAYAVVRTAGRAWSEALQSHQPAPALWGLLHTDGSFRPAPAEVLEPLTDADGWIPHPPAGTPLTSFLTNSGEIVFLDRDAVIAFRIRYDNRATLLDAQGNPLWQSAVREGCQAPAPFFHRPVEAMLDGLKALDDVVPCAEAMLAETETKLHAYAAGQPVLAEPDGDDYDDDDYDDDDDEDDSALEASRVVTSRRLLRAYLGPSHNSDYDFLFEFERETVAAAASTWLNALRERFGAPDPDPEHGSRRHRRIGITSAWPVRLRQAIAGADNPLHEAQELWLGFYQLSETGDGDAWHELWLMCAPSVDALETAGRARALAASAAVCPDSAVEDSGQAPRVPQTYGDWLAAVRQDRYAIAQVPISLLDDAMVDAAVEADAGALEYVPAQWQTSARLEALIRQGVAAAVAIPPQCMTAQGLALARALYDDDQEWQWRDDANSALPSKWSEGCLDSVWGALLTEELCVRAVSGGEALREVPRWLRTARVEQAALDADIANLGDVARERVTPELAERAVWHEDGNLIGHIPEALLTPELCLISASVNGMSLEYVPVAMRSVDVCVAALQYNTEAFPFVPDGIREDVYTRLIEMDLMRAKHYGEERTVSHWHGYRAWSRLQRGEYDAAIADARLALDSADYPRTLHYVLASAYRAQGRTTEAALEASTVLSTGDTFTVAFDEAEDTSWLETLATGQFDDVDDAALMERIQSHPWALADIPRARLTHELVATALAADPGTIELVPKRLMTAERYALAIRQRVKSLCNIPAAMLSEDACIEHVRYNGSGLRDVPVEWRTVQVCAHALNYARYALEYVPEPIRQAALEAMAGLPGRPDLDDEDG